MKWTWCWLSTACLYTAVIASSKSREYDPANFFHFVTRPDLQAPKWKMAVYDSAALQTGMYWFVSPYSKLEQVDYFDWNGPHIYDDAGRLIWSGAGYTGNVNAFDFRVSSIDGNQQMLSFIWPKHPEGNGWILDNTYTKYKIVDMIGNKTKWNMHEFNLVDDGQKALMLYHPEFEPSQYTDENYSGPCNIGWQGMKEVDVNTGEVYYEWDSEGNIDVTESDYIPSDTRNQTRFKCAAEWDITHFNSVDRFPDGDYLVSARHTDTIYKISRKDKSIVWRLGGPRSDFVPTDERVLFSRQHHARVRGQNSTHVLITLFDNATGTGNHEGHSSGDSWGLYLALRTDVFPMEVSLVSRYQHPVPDKAWDSATFTRARGSMDILPNGNAFMGWSVSSCISEHSPDGRLLMRARMLQPGADSYRSYKMPWKGYPAQPIDVVSQIKEDAERGVTTTVYVSWNGATEVDSWHVLQSDGIGNITTLVASERWQDFETVLPFNGYAANIIAVALDRYGNELGRSAVIKSDVSEDMQAESYSDLQQEWEIAHQGEKWIPKTTHPWAASTLYHRAKSQPLFKVSMASMVLMAVLAIILYRRRRTLCTQWSSAMRFLFGWKQPWYDGVPKGMTQSGEQRWEAKSEA